MVAVETMRHDQMLDIIWQSLEKLLMAGYRFEKYREKKGLQNSRPEQQDGAST